MSFYFWFITNLSYPTIKVALFFDSCEMSHYNSWPYYWGWSLPYDRRISSCWNRVFSKKRFFKLNLIKISRIILKKNSVSPYYAKTEFNFFLNNIISHSQEGAATCWSKYWRCNVCSLWYICVYITNGPPFINLPTVV